MRALYTGIACICLIAGCYKYAEETSNQAELSVAAQTATLDEKSAYPILVPHDSDPSANPVLIDGVFQSQWRLIADFDGDELLDMGLTEGDPFDANFTLYLRTHEGYKEAGLWEINCRDPISIEYVNPPCFSRLWSSGHISGSESLINYTELKSGIIVTNNMFPNCFELSWGRPEGCDGENKLPNELHDAIFKNSSSPIWREKSIFTNGVFRWIPCRVDHLRKKKSQD